MSAACQETPGASDQESYLSLSGQFKSHHARWVSPETRASVGGPTRTVEATVDVAAPRPRPALVISVIRVTAIEWQPAGFRQPRDFTCSSGWASGDTKIAPGGTSFITTALTPMTALSPIVIGPTIFAPAQIRTLLPMVGAPFFV